CAYFVLFSTTAFTSSRTIDHQDLHSFPTRRSSDLIKKKLLDGCNLHTIVRLPNGVFAPYTSIKTNLLFFTKGEPTKGVWYYEHPDRKSTRLNSSHVKISYAVFCLKKKNKKIDSDSL